MSDAMGMQYFQINKQKVSEKTLERFDFHKNNEMTFTQ